VLIHRVIPDRRNLIRRLHGYPNCNSRLPPRIRTPLSVRSLSSNRKSHPVFPRHSGAVVTRVCVQCKELLGEKCVQCGAEAAPVDSNTQGHPPTRIEFRCPACRRRFSRGEGGETGGMCKPCLDEALRKAHEVQTASRQ
jgi:hypothetical protein